MKKNIYSSKVIIVDSGRASNKTKELLLQNLLQFDGVQIEESNESDFFNLESDLGADFCIYFLSNKDFQAISRISRACHEKSLRTLFVGAIDGKLILGPTFFPGLSAAGDSAYLLHLNYKLGRLPTESELFSFVLDDFSQATSRFTHVKINELVCAILKELHEFIKPSKNLSYIDQIYIFSSERHSPNQKKYVFPLFKDKIPEASPGKVSREEYAAIYTQLKRSIEQIKKRKLFLRKSSRNKHDGYTSVGIVGGGTSGYLTALALKKSFPDLPVTLIESSKIPIIGVGEATTPGINTFLFKTLGFSKKDFYEKVKPTWKLGIKFFWGLPGDYHYNYPFDKADILSSYLFNGDINHCSLSSMLMSNDSSFVIPIQPNGCDDNQYVSLSKSINYALHLNNRDFVLYLRNKADEMGIKLVDDLIVSCHRNELSGNIDYVIGEGGKKYQFDLFVDCSGFKSLLLEKTMEAEYVSFEKSLFTDCAITAKRNHYGKVRPYTYAETMNNGWCWHIPMRDADHMGYVFSQAFCSDEQAIQELKQKYPDIEIQKKIRFRSGRHSEIMRNNVFAIGNSYAFVEPLESTGIYMILAEINLLKDNFLSLKNSPSTKKMINEHMNARWDYLKNFLAIHFKFNKKTDSRFWRYCHTNTDVSEVQWLIDLYKEKGPLSYIGGKTQKMINNKVPDTLFGLLGIDTLLMGQGVFPNKMNVERINEPIWYSNIRLWKSITERTIPLKEDIDVLVNHPQLI